ncbi:TetR/AcrR family transcriptional regulator [Perlucidibaca piscinae]|uniref:TetR/AcrR family transcriptional regulator n=1 Tax=Perlucidibaca piscinae TaxID=392589 RepID=UPI001B7FEBEA|nr:TetR/AcrR family transcriptional regulator [Perlucidibaca piscinae]
MARATQKAREFRQREQSILDCAQALFMEMGEDKVTVEMIADKVGIGKGTIYKHFETKNEIYLLLMIRYEEELAELFQRIDTSEDKAALVREYFSFRVKDADKYLLFDRLESKLVADKAGKLADVPPTWHIAAAWALAHGASALSKSSFYTQFIGDKEPFLEFLLNVAVRMGNRGVLGAPADKRSTKGG